MTARRTIDRILRDEDDASAQTVRLVGSRGTIDARQGDAFADLYGTAGGGVWIIAGFTNQRIYSPSGLGGTPIVRCKLVQGEMPAHWGEYVDADGCVEWCGDSVASLLILAAERRASDLQELAQLQGREG